MVYMDVKQSCKQLGGDSLTHSHVMLARKIQKDWY